MKVLGIIPARKGSKGIPGKNLKILNGKPLIEYTIDQGVQSANIDELIVSSDCQDICDFAQSKGVNVPFVRPSGLASDESPSIDYIIHALDFFESKGRLFDMVCILQPTSPFRPIGCIDSAIEKLESSQADTLISVRKIPDHYNPMWSFKIGETGNLEKLSDDSIITSRQMLPDFFIRDGAIYVIRFSTIKNKRSIFGEHLVHFEIASPELINIDSLSDWEIAEKYIHD